MILKLTQIRSMDITNFEGTIGQKAVYLWIFSCGMLAMSSKAA